MDEQLKSALLLFLNDLNSSKEFVLSQAPEVVKQLLLYETIQYSAFSLFLGVISSLVFYRCFKFLKAAESYDDDRYLCYLVLFLNSFVTALAITSLTGAIKVIFMPELFIFEYIAEFIK